MSRKIDSCRFCKTEGEIAAQGLCFRCYRRLERAIKPKSGADAAVQHDDRRLLRLYAATINNLAELGVPREGILEIKKAYLDKCVGSVAMYLNTSSEEESD